jgi:hypothetical protein
MSISRVRTLQLGMNWQLEDPGGLNRVYYDLVRYLPQASIEFDGLVTSSIDVATSSGGLVRSFAPRTSSTWERCWKMRKSVRQLMQEKDYDLIVSHFALYALPILDLLGDRPFVFHFHGPWALESSVEAKSLNTWLKKAIEGLIYGRATEFIVLSQAFRDILHQEYRIPCDRISIVPGGVDVDRFNLTCSRSVARTKLGWSQDRFYSACDVWLDVWVWKI